MINFTVNELAGHILDRVLLILKESSSDFNKKDTLVLDNRQEVQDLFIDALQTTISAPWVWPQLRKQQKDKLISTMSAVIAHEIKKIPVTKVYPYRKLGYLMSISQFKRDKRALIKKGISIIGTMVLRRGLLFETRLAYRVKIGVPSLDITQSLMLKSLRYLIAEEYAYRNMILACKYFKSIGSGPTVMLRIASFLLTQAFLAHYNLKGKDVLFVDLKDYRLNPCAKEKNKADSGSNIELKIIS